MYICVCTFDITVSPACQSLSPLEIQGLELNTILTSRTGFSPNVSLTTYRYAKLKPQPSSLISQSIRVLPGHFSSKRRTSAFLLKPSTTFVQDLLLEEFDATMNRYWRGNLCDGDTFGNRPGFHDSIALFHNRQPRRRPGTLFRTTQPVMWPLC